MQFIWVNQRSLIDSSDLRYDAIRCTSRTFEQYFSSGNRNTFPRFRISTISQSRNVALKKFIVKTLINNAMHVRCIISTTRGNSNSICVCHWLSEITISSTYISPSLDAYTTTIRVSGKLLNPIVAPDMRSIIKSTGIT